MTREEMRPYLNGKCEKCVYHYLLDGDESRCTKIRIGSSDVMCVQVIVCKAYKRRVSK